MGFKRTSEGRVFFKGSEYSANDEQLVKEDRPSRPAARPAVDQTQLQILTLLKTLNEKLKSTQIDRRRLNAELDAYRRLVQDLEAKTQQSERAYLELESKINNRDSEAVSRAENAENLAKKTIKELENTRKTLLAIQNKSTKAGDVSSLQSQIEEYKKLSETMARRQSKIEQKQVEQGTRLDQGIRSYNKLLDRIQQTITLQNDFKDRLAISTVSVEDLTDRIKRSEAKQETLDQKLIENHEQSQRVLERVDKAIEDRAKFMRKMELIEDAVLQTRDALQAKDGNALPAPEADLPKQFRQLPQDSVEDEEQTGFWGKTFRFKTAGVAFLVVAGILTGWAVSEVQKPEISPTDEFDLQILEQQSVPVERTTESVDESAIMLEAPYGSLSISTFSPEEQAELLGLFESDPGALAEKLNNIEPSSEAASGSVAVVENVEPVEEAVSAKAQEPESFEVAALTPPQEKIEEKIAPKAEEPAASIVKEEPVEVKKPDPVVQEAKPAPKKVEAAQKPAEGYDMSQDPALPDVIKEIERRAFEGYPEAQHDLAAVYTAGHAGVKQDYKRAAYWFEQAAGSGIGNARYNLGVLYHQGLGVPQDMERAIEWYQGAADLGHPEAQYNLGIAYIEGIGVNYDPAKAAENFESAANGGIVEAAYNLGLIYENGLLGKAKPDEALLWYKTAADQGSPEAKAALQQLARALDINLQDVNALVESVRSVKNSKPNAVDDAYDEYVEPVSVSKVNAQAVLISQVQEHLMAEGLYPGPADGINGPLTRDAIRTYQSSNGMDTDGLASEDLLRHMLANVKNYDVHGAVNTGTVNQ